MKKSEASLHALWDTVKRNDIILWGFQKEQRKRKGQSICKKIMAQNFLNLWRELEIVILEAEKVPDRLNPNKATLRHIIIKLLKSKTEKEL